MIDHLTEQAAQLLPPLSAARRDQLRKRAARYLPRDPLKLFNTRLADCQRAVAAIEDKGGIPTPGQIRRLYRYARRLSAAQRALGMAPSALERLFFNA